MKPYFPTTPLLVEDYCDHRHFCITIHRIDCIKYFAQAHKICFIAVCMQCEQDYGEGGTKIMMRMSDWKNFIDSFSWDVTIKNEN